MDPKPINQILRQSQELAALVDQSNLTSPEQEEYILTPEEEELAIRNAKQRLLEWYAWHMADQGQSREMMLLKLSQLDLDNDPNLNRAEILKRANSAKQNQLWHQEQRRKEADSEKEKQKTLREHWTAKRMYQFMIWTCQTEYGKHFVQNEDNFPLIRALCYFLSEDPRFESELGYSFQKGLIIRGASGLGKTFLVNCLAQNELNPIRCYSMIEIIDAVKREGEYQVTTGKKIIYLDDVGTEATPVIHFGTRINWFKDFLELYYDTKKPFNRLILSTNIKFDDIEEKYTHRVRSRMKEMFNVINVKGEDLRK